MEAASVTTLTTRLTCALDQLQTALAKLGGADAPSQQYGDPAAGRALALIAAGVETPDTVQMETRALHEHLQRLFGLFSAAGSSASSSQRMTALGFRKLVRAAQLTSERCTDVDVDLIFQQVVRTRGARMSVGDMMVGLSMVAKRLYPAERTQSAAFHKLLAEQLLPWMLQVCAASPSHQGTAFRPAPVPLFATHVPALPLHAVAAPTCACVGNPASFVVRRAVSRAMSVTHTHRSTSMRYKLLPTPDKQANARCDI